MVGPDLVTKVPDPTTAGSLKLDVAVWTHNYFDWAADLIGLYGGLNWAH